MQTCWIRDFAGFARFREMTTPPPLPRLVSSLAGPTFLALWEHCQLVISFLLTWC